MSSPSYSSPDTRWRRLPEERPHQILEAAIAEFGEHGIGGARLERIASRAGVSKGTIYLYFKNKTEIVAAICAETFEALIESLEEIESRNLPPLEAFIAGIAAGRRQYLEGFHIAFDHWHSTHSKENTELSQDLYRRLKAKGLIYSKAIEQLFDPVKGMFLADRYITGT